MKLYDIQSLEFERPNVIVYVKFVSLKHPEDNYEGKATVISNNHVCVIASNKKHQFFTLYFEDCLNKKATTVENEEHLEFYQFTKKGKVLDIDQKTSSYILNTL